MSQVSTSPALGIATKPERRDIGLGRRYAAELSAFAQEQPGMPGWHAITDLVLRLQAAGRDLPSALRVARHLVMERVAVLDIEQGATLDAVSPIDGTRPS